MRGMVKWLPFKSLVGQEKYIDELKEEKNKISKPILSVDQEEEISETLNMLKIGDEVEIEYYLNGRIISTIEEFKKIDINSKRIYLNNNNFDINNLIKIKKLK